MKKSWMLGLMFVSMLIFSSVMVSANLYDNIKDIGQEVLNVAKLDWVNGGTGVSGENYLTGFMRLAIFFLIFVLLFELASRTNVLQRNTAIAVAAILSIISAIFIPGSVLAAIGISYATLFSFILIGSVIVGGLFLVYMIPTSSLGLRILRIILLILLFWILSATVDHAKVLVP
ncbi:MAG: hypothetical protein V2A62_01450 [Candidatus Woesearchaeota archaeon]